MNRNVSLPARVLAQLTRIKNNLLWLPPLLARITIGVVFVQSGWGKLHDLPSIVEFFRTLGIPAPQIQAPMVATIELTCGCLVLGGLLTRFASIPLIGTMVVAIITAKQEDFHGWTSVFGFSEFLYIVLLTYLIMEGAGALSVDRWFTRGWELEAKMSRAATPALV